MIYDKKKLRKIFKEIRDSIDNSVRTQQSELITGRLINLNEYKNANTIFAYVSFGSEVETDILLNQILKDGKTLCVPLCDTRLKTMSAILIDDLRHLKSGAYGILEPPKIGQAVSPDDIDLVIVPALAFDKTGMRLGYGGGYYDKFLSDFKGISIGLAYSECMAELLPAEEFDCRVNMVICTEGKN